MSDCNCGETTLEAHKTYEQAVRHAVDKADVAASRAALVFTRIFGELPAFIESHHKADIAESLTLQLLRDKSV